MISDLKKDKLSALYGALMKRLETNQTTATSIIKLYGAKDSFYDYFNAMITDYQYRCPTNNLADYYSKFNTSVYVYLYGVDQIGVTGALHADELTKVFANDLASEESSSSERLFTEQVVGFWGNFIINNKPSNKNEWPKFNTETFSSVNRNLFNLKPDNSQVNVFKTTDDAVCQFWDKFTQPIPTKNN